MLLTPSAIEAQFNRPGEKRYTFFLRTAVQEEEVFGLADDEGWALFSEEADDTEAMPVFPAAPFAEQFRQAAGFDDYRVETLDLMEFMEWLTDFESKKMKVAVFPNLEFQGVVIDARRLRDDLQAEMDKEKGEA